MESPLQSVWKCHELLQCVLPLGQVPLPLESYLKETTRIAQKGFVTALFVKTDSVTILGMV